MSPLVVRAMRRATLYAGLVTIGLILYYKVLPAAGLIGPTPQQEIDATAGTLETARVYGAGAGMPAFDAAQAGLERARSLLAGGSGFGARRAAQDARALAIAAQRDALTRREDERRRAQQAVDEIDRLLSGLEDAYPAAVAGKSQEETSRLLGLMRQSRETGAALFLAFEQNNFHKVLAEEAAVRRALGDARGVLDAASRQPGAK